MKFTKDRQNYISFAHSEILVITYAMHRVTNGLPNRNETPAVLGPLHIKYNDFNKSHLVITTMVFDRSMCLHEVTPSWMKMIIVAGSGDY